MSFKDVDIDSGGGDFLRLKDGENRIRIVSEPVSVWTSFNRTEGTAKKYLTLEGAQTDPEARKRHAMWVIDRADQNNVKLAEFGPSIMGSVKAIANATETAFDGLPPFDFIITRTGQGMDTSYTVQASRQETELTKIEIKELENRGSVTDFLKKDAKDGDSLKSDKELESVPF